MKTTISSKTFKKREREKERGGREEKNGPSNMKTNEIKDDNKRVCMDIEEVPERRMWTNTCKGGIQGHNKYKNKP